MNETHVFIDIVYNKRDQLKSINRLPPDPSTFTPVIPLILHHIWTGETVPPIMNKTINGLLAENPEFKHMLYHDKDCQRLILNNIGERVWKSYNKIVPGAFKADLCRYCVLYVYGGIYLDVKFKAVNGFKLISLTDREHFVIDRYLSRREDYTINLYNAIIITKAKSKVMKRAIDIVNHNIETNYYGENYLYITGPKVLGEAYIGSIETVKNYLESTMKKIEKIDLTFGCCNPSQIKYHRTALLTPYPEYMSEKLEFYNKTNARHYTAAWNRRTVYGEDKES